MVSKGFQHKKLCLIFPTVFVCQINPSMLEVKTERQIRAHFRLTEKFLYGREIKKISIGTGRDSVEK